MGLLDAAQQPKIAAQSAPKPQPNNLDERQNQMLTLAVNQASMFLLEYENARTLADMAETSDPVTAIVEMAPTILRAIYDSAKQAGHELPPEMISLIGNDVANVMASVLVLMDVIEQKDMADVAKQAYKIAIDKHNSGAAQAQPQAPTQAAPAQAAPAQPTAQGV